MGQRSFQPDQVLIFTRKKVFNFQDCTIPQNVWVVTLEFHEVWNGISAVDFFLWGFNKQLAVSKKPFWPSEWGHDVTFSDCIVLKNKF